MHYRWQAAKPWRAFSSYTRSTLFNHLCFAFKFLVVYRRISLHRHKEVGPVTCRAYCIRFLAWNSWITNGKFYTSEQGSTTWPEVKLSVRLLTSMFIAKLNISKHLECRTLISSFAFRLKSYKCSPFHFVTPCIF